MVVHVKYLQHYSYAIYVVVGQTCAIGAQGGRAISDVMMLHGIAHPSLSVHVSPDAPPLNVSLY